jgi:signal transduction histidine kinase
MKLINQFTLWYLCISAFVLLAGGMIVFYSVQREIIDEEGRRLKDTVKLIAGLLEKGTRIDDIAGHQVVIRELDPAAAEIPVSIQDTIAWFEPHQHFERELRASASYKIKGRHYFIAASNLVAEPDEIFEGVVQSISWMFVLLLLVVVISGRLMSRAILTPFHKTLSAIESFHLKQKDPVRFVPSRTDEFRKLNTFLGEMTTKALEDYRSLKEFTENASHELQTPLAIMRGKLELLLNSPITHTQAQLLADAHQAVDKLSQVNKSLTLLTRLENHEFVSVQPVDLSKLTLDTLDTFAELIELKNLTLQTSIEADVRIRLHALLASILLNNLVSNAIRHNYPNGSIYVSLTPAALHIRNTGSPPQLPTHQLFERFKKSNQSHESIGLGLAIVKQICEVNHFRIRYSYAEAMHALEVNFTEKG